MSRANDLTAEAKKPTKYRAKKCTATRPDGSIIKFDSQLEKAYWATMRMLGSKLERNSLAFKLNRGEKYIPDFVVDSHPGSLVPTLFIEIKGGKINGKGKKTSNATPQFRSKMRAMREMYPEIRLVVIYGYVDRRGFFRESWQEWPNGKFEVTNFLCSVPTSQR